MKRRRNTISRKPKLKRGLSLFPCFHCKKVLRKPEFTKRQLLKGNDRRCRKCAAADGEKARSRGDANIARVGGFKLLEQIKQLDNNTKKRQQEKLKKKPTNKQQEEKLKKKRTGRIPCSGCGRWRLPKKFRLDEREKGDDRKCRGCCKAKPKGQKDKETGDKKAPLLPKSKQRPNKRKRNRNEPTKASKRPKPQSSENPKSGAKVPENVVKKSLTPENDTADQTISGSEESGSENESGSDGGMVLEFDADGSICSELHGDDSEDINSGAAKEVTENFMGTLKNRHSKLFSSGKSHKRKKLQKKMRKHTKNPDESSKKM